MYITVNQGDTLYSESVPILIHYVDANDDFHLFDVWTDSDTALKTSAIKQATRIIDSFQYDGSKKDAEQDNEFPRMGQVGVPTNVKRACFVMALEILRRHQLYVHNDPVTQNYLDNGAKSIHLSVSNASERIQYSEERSLNVIAYPYLKKWIRGRFDLVAGRAM